MKSWSAVIGALRSGYCFRPLVGLLEIGMTWYKIRQKWLQNHVPDLTRKCNTKFNHTLLFKCILSGELAQSFTLSSYKRLLCLLQAIGRVLLLRWSAVIDALQSVCCFGLLICRALPFFNFFNLQSFKRMEGIE